MYMVDWDEDRRMREAAVKANEQATEALRIVISLRNEGTQRQFIEALEAFEQAVKAATRRNDAVARRDELFRSETGSASAGSYVKEKLDGYRRDKPPIKINLEPEHVEWLKKLSEDEK